MEAVLLANVASTLFMVGLAWFVHGVHYPLFAAVGDDAFLRYHQTHSQRTTWVVLPVMSVELLTSVVLVFDPPGGQTALVTVGAALAAGTWALTALAAVPAHRGLGEGFSADGLRRLGLADLVRALVWTAHGGVVLGLLATQI